MAAARFKSGPRPRPRAPATNLKRAAAAIPAAGSSDSDMVRIIKPTEARAGPEGRERAERRLAAAMLNVEHAALVYGDDLEPRPPPHAPWPVVVVPPLTARGLPVEAHYRAAVGVVFYTEGEGFRVAELARRLGAALGAAGDAHLRAHRAVGATPAAVLRRRGAVAGGTRVVGPRPHFRKVEARDDGGAGLPARILMWPGRGQYKLPPHYSLRAAFTWVFMEVPAAFEVGELGDMAAVNAMVASVLYDDALLARAEDGAEVFRLGAADFTPPPAPAGLDGGGGVPGLGGDLLGAGEGGLVVDPGTAALAYVGRPRSLRVAGAWPPAGWRRVAGAAGIRAAPWDPAGLLLRAPGAFQCCACAAPIGGLALVIRGARAPVRSEHRVWAYCALERGEPLLGGAAPAAGPDPGLLLCFVCFAALERPECLTAHLGARLEATAVPLTQAEACRACPGYERLADLLEGRAEAVRGAPGAFVVRPAAGAALPGPVVLAGQKLGAYPAFTVPGLAALGLPVVPGVRLVEVRRPPGVRPGAIRGD